MSEAKNGNGYSQMWDSHEDRIHDLERGRLEINKEVSEQTATLRAIQDDIHDLSKSQKDLNRTVNNLLIKMSDGQKSDAVTEIWHKWWGKVLLLAVPSLGGALFTWIMERLGNH